MHTFSGKDLKNVKNTLLENIKLFIGQSKFYVFLLCCSILVSTIFAVLAPYTFASIIDNLSTNKSIENIGLGFVIYAVLLGLSLVFKEAVTYLAVILAETLNYISSTNFLKKILLKESHFFIQHNPSEIQAMQNQGVFALNKVMQLGLISFIPSVLQIVFSCFILGAEIDFKIVTIVILYGSFCIGLSYFSSIRIEQYLEEATSERQKNIQLLGNAMSMMDVLRFFNAGSWIDQRFQQGSQQILKSLTSYSLKRTYYAVIFGIALTIQFLISFYILIPEVQAGRMSVGDLVLFNALLLQLNTPFEMIGRCILEFNQSYIEFKPFARMWNEPELRDNINQPIASFSTSDDHLGLLKFQDVSFSYTNGRGIQDINFTAERGKITFLTGDSGAGKSTIFKLILKQIQPDQGDIIVNNIPLNGIARNTWFSQIGVVPQEVMLLNDTIKNNICLGRTYDDQKIYQAAKKAQILDRIKMMPDGFDTVVGERGMTLSGGEKQRISIARALYADPEFLLLDEASSSLDGDTEYEIMSHMRSLKDSVTIIAITHNSRLIHTEDMVIKL
ncbi:ABC transporter ATP-binding protein [Acinetobacter sp. 1207_04]|uniref:ABC transporter ATP-binding protein n=1 Tax=Acinetobacter sp. 1207_04 TaxID=2604449 RepID=UPI0040588322